MSSIASQLPALGNIISFGTTGTSGRMTSAQAGALHARFLDLANGKVPASLLTKIINKKIKVYYTACDNIPGLYIVNLVMMNFNKAHATDVARGFFCIMYGDELSFHGAREKFHNYVETKFAVNRMFVTMKVSGSMIMMTSVKIEGIWYLVMTSKNSAHNEYTEAAKTIIPSFWKELNPEGDFQEVIDSIGESGQTMICELMSLSDKSHGNTPARDSFVIHGVSSCPNNDGLMKFLEPDGMANRLRELHLPFTTMYIITEASDIGVFDVEYPKIRDANDFQRLMASTANITIVGTVRHSPEDPGEGPHLYTNQILEGVVTIAFGFDATGNSVACIEKRKLWPYVITTMDNGLRDILTHNGVEYIMNPNNDIIIAGFRGLINRWVHKDDHAMAMTILVDALQHLKGLIRETDIVADAALKAVAKPDTKYAQDFIRGGYVTETVHKFYLATIA
jgi:hypothetical protein